LHIQDYEIDAALQLGIVPENISKIILLLENFLLKRFDAISTISESMKNKLCDKGMNMKKIFLFPNWANMDDVILDKDLGNDFRIMKGLKRDDFLILYSGNIGKKQGLEIVVEAANILKDFNDIKFIFCGHGADKKNIINLVNRYKLNNCLFYPLQDKEDFNAMLNSANVHLIIQKSVAADLVMPSKLTNIIASGGFSIVTAEPNTELGNLFSAHNYLGYSISPNDSLTLAESIQKIKLNNNLIDSKKIRKFAEENFEVNKIMTSFNEQIKDI
jgi:colanic acid biosynthesis glycosyl transferase WcaI